MMNNAWKINEGDRNYGKGWTNKSESPQKPGQMAQQRNAPAAGGRPGTATQAQTMSRPQTGYKAQGASASGYAATSSNIFGSSSQALITTTISYPRHELQ
jgi:hypothetical protein